MRDGSGTSSGSGMSVTVVQYGCRTWKAAVYEF